MTDLRILGVRAEVAGSYADPTPDDSVQLEALVANPLGLTGLRVRWFTCEPTGTDTVPPCVEADFLRDPAAYAGVPGVLELPAGPGTGEAPPAIPLSLLPPEAVAAALEWAMALATSEPTYQCRVYVELPLVVLAEAEGRREVALKRVRLVPRPADVAPPLDGYVRNENPSLLAVVRGPAYEDLCTGGSLVEDAAPFPAGRTVLCGRADAPGPYNVCGPDGERTPVLETHSWQWYVTGGELPEFDGTGNATGDAVEFDRPPGAFTLWAILRDGRGGEDWVRRDVAALP